VRKAGAKAKFWVAPVGLDSSDGFDRAAYATWSGSSKKRTPHSSKGHGMSISARTVRFDDDCF
jgi:hypothetical protein